MTSSNANLGTDELYSNKEKTSNVNIKIPNQPHQNRDKRNLGYINNIGIKTKEYFANENDIEIKNYQANTGKNIRTNLQYNLNANSEMKNKNVIYLIFFKLK